MQSVDPRETYHPTEIGRWVRRRIDASILISRLGPTLTHPTRSSSVQREHEHVARALELIELDRMQMATAGLHREKLLRPDRVGHRRALERRAEIEPPQLLELLVVIGHEPAILQRGEHHAAGGDE